MTTGIGIAQWGPNVICTDVDEALLAKLRMWLPTYLVHGAGERELDYALAEPRTYSNVLDNDEFLDNQIPAVLVTAAETATVIGGDTVPYQAVWRTTVSCVVRGRVGKESRFNAAVFEGAVRRVLLQKGADGETCVNKVKWVGVKIRPVSDTTGKGRYLAAGVATYNVATDYAAQGFGGPDIPDAEAYLGLAKVEEVTTEVDPKP